jgi:hypothetical protein
MAESPINTRNDALEFARRARTNLRFIEEAAAHNPGTDVHVVTQLALSLLGMVVFPQEKLLLDRIQEVTLDSLAGEGWPVWQIRLQDPSRPTLTLGDLIWHLRNAVAHGLITFTSDSPKMDEVMFIVKDRKKRSSQPYWCAEIWAPELRTFCEHYLLYIEDAVG